MSLPSPSPNINSIRRKREDCDISLRGLARLTGISYPRLHHIEYGRQASALELLKIAKALGCGPEDLVEQETGRG